MFLLWLSNIGLAALVGLNGVLREDSSFLLREDGSYIIREI